MKHSFKAGVAVLVFTLVPACSGSFATDGPEESLEAESVATARSALTECLARHDHKSYSAGLQGASSDVSYPMNGKTVTRVDFKFDVSANDWLGLGGHGDAKVTKQDSTEVVVHYWYDLFTDLNYDIDIWVEC